MPTIYKPPRRKRASNPRKDSESYKRRREVYNTKAWQRLRLVKLSEQPLCEVCLSRGVTTPADDVHHVVSFTGFADRDTRRAYAFDLSNLQSICKRCHAREHGRGRHSESNG